MKPPASARLWSSGPQAVTRLTNQEEGDEENEDTHTGEKRAEVRGQICFGFDSLKVIILQIAVMVDFVAPIVTMATLRKS